MKLGRTRPKVQYPRLRMRNYLMRTLPTPPETTDYWPAAASALRQVYLNDQLGDCVIAGLQHVEGVMTGNAGRAPLIFDDANTKRLYHAIGGYVDGDASTDNGCDEQTAMAYWKANSLGGSSSNLLGYASVNGNDLDEVRSVQWLMENVIFGVELPDDWLANPSDGFVWDIAGDSNPNNGHCFVGVDIEANGLAIATWGMRGTITWAAIQKYATRGLGGEMYTALSMDSINRATQKAPSGFDSTQLMADLQAIS